MPERPETQLARYYRRKALGYCVGCCIPVEDGHVRCRDCRIKNSARVMASRKRREAKDPSITLKHKRMDH